MIRLVRGASFGILLAFSAACASSTGPDGNETNVRIEGHVYGGCAPSAVAGPCVLANPINGAVVSTSLDSATTTTDASGHFDLRTNSPKSKGYCHPYTLTVTAAGYPTYSVTGPWGSHPVGQRITLSPPNPSFVGCT